MHAHMANYIKINNRIGILLYELFQKVGNFVPLYSNIDTYVATYIATLLYYTVNNIAIHTLMTM